MHFTKCNNTHTSQNLIYIAKYNILFLYNLYRIWHALALDHVTNKYISTCFNTHVQFAYTSGVEIQKIEKTQKMQKLAEVETSVYWDKQNSSAMETYLT